MSIAESFLRAPTARKLMCALSFALLLLAISLTPAGYREIRESSALEQYGVEALGKVVSLEPILGRNKCSSSALIQYIVQTQVHQITARGCGASADGQLHIGAQARVLYLPNAPSVARATSFGVSSKRANWPGFVLGWLVTLTFLAFTWIPATRSYPSDTNAS